MAAACWKLSGGRRAQVFYARSPFRRSAEVSGPRMNAMLVAQLMDDRGVHFGRTDFIVTEIQLSCATLTTACRYLAALAGHRSPRNRRPRPRYPAVSSRSGGSSGEPLIGNMTAASFMASARHSAGSWQAWRLPCGAAPICRMAAPSTLMLESECKRRWKLWSIFGPLTVGRKDKNEAQSSVKIKYYSIHGLLTVEFN